MRELMTRDRRKKSLNHRMTSLIGFFSPPRRYLHSLYCNDTCRARDGQSKHSTTGLQPGVSPSILASLPGLLASRARQSHGSAAFGFSSGHQSTTHTSTSTASSQSATSSPLQSPSPFTAPEQAGVSPQEDTFHLPPPAYPTVPIGFSPVFSASSHPVKIPASLRALPSAVPSPQRTMLDLAGTGTQHVATDSTLHYGRRPGLTNSITSPLALFPVGGSYSRRRQSNDKLVRPAPNALGLSPSRQGWSLHGTGASVNVSNGRIVSDSSSGPHANGLGKQAVGYINYGAHSPLIAAANRRPASTSAVDAFEVQGSVTSTASTAGTIVGAGAGPLSSSVRQVNVITPFGSQFVANLDGTTIKSANPSYFERRRSFPLQPTVQRMSPTAAAQGAATAQNPGSTATSAIEDDDFHLSDADDGRRGRGRSRETRDSSVARREMTSSDRDRQSSAASSRGESRRRSRRRSPSDSRNRRIVERIQPDVIPEVEDRGRVARKIATQSKATSPSPSSTSVEKINVFVQPQPSQPALIASSQPRFNGGGQRHSLSRPDSSFYIPPASHRPAPNDSRDWNHPEWNASNYKNTGDNTTSRTSLPVTRGGFHQKSMSSDGNGNASGTANRRINEQDSRAARALKMLFEEGMDS